MIDTWSCHICKKERPDSKIAVLTKPLIFGGVEVGSQNIRYCNDNLSCIEGAKIFSFLNKKGEQMDIEKKVIEIASEQLGVKLEEVKPASRFIDDLGVDSLDRVELMMALEEAFNIEIPDEDAEKVNTVEDAVKYINEKVKAK